MLIRSCFQCKFHEVKEVNSEKISGCGRENCYSRFSKCIANKALNRYLEQESSDRDHPITLQLSMKTALHKGRKTCEDPDCG